MNVINSFVQRNGRNGARYRYFEIEKKREDVDAKYSKHA